MTTCGAETSAGEPHGKHLADGAFVCTGCAATLARRLAGVPALLVDLEITLTRQDRLGEPGHGADALSWKATVPDAIWALGNTLTTWARELSERHRLPLDETALRRPIRAARGDHAQPIEGTAGAEQRCEETGLIADQCGHCRDLPVLRVVLPDDAVPARPRPPRPAPAVLGHRPPSELDSVRLAARWLLLNIATVRTDHEAVEVHDEVTSAIAQAEAACSAPPLQLFVGTCDHPVRYVPEVDDAGKPTGRQHPVLCGADLYARPDFRATPCPGCGTTHADMARRWDRALERVRHFPATAAVIARHVGELYGVQLDRKKINLWHSRGDLTMVDRDDDGHPRFRIGEVLERAREGDRRRRAAS